MMKGSFRGYQMQIAFLLLHSNCDNPLLILLIYTLKIDKKVQVANILNLYIEIDL